MKLFLRTNDVNAMREIRKAATGKLLLGIITDITNPEQLRALPEAVGDLVVPIQSGDPDQIKREVSAFREVNEHIVPAIQFGRSALQTINWLAEQRCRALVCGTHNSAQAVFAAQAGAAYIAAHNAELLEAYLEAIEHYGGGIDVPYSDSWDTAIIRMSVHKIGDVFDAIEQGADACAVSPEMFWEILDSTAMTEPKLLCETDEEKNTHQPTRHKTKSKA